MIRRIVDFALVSGDFSIESGMLTPKMSLKRRKVIEVYAPVIEQLYARKRGSTTASSVQG